MTISEINSWVDFRGSTNTTEFTAAQRLISLNNNYEKVVTMILDAASWNWDDTNRTDFAIATTNLVAGQSDYAIPVNTIQVKRIETSFDAVNWSRPGYIDINQVNTATDATTLSAIFSTDIPSYGLRGESIFIYPTPTATVSNGLKIWYSRGADSFTSAQVSAGTKEPGFDKQFHPLIPLGMVMDWFVSKKDWKAFDKAKEEYVDWERRLRHHYANKHEDSHTYPLPNDSYLQL